VSLVHHDRDGLLNLRVASYHHVNWYSSSRIREDSAWPVGRWHHVACVWDAQGERDDSLRMYVDGRKVAGLTTAAHEERLGEDRSIRVRTDAPFVAQVGSLNSGRLPANACFDELRISRSVRYTGDFAPPTQELALDKDTSALFDFNGSLKGEGMTPEGKRYTIPATAGVCRYR